MVRIDHIGNDIVALAPYPNPGWKRIGYAERVLTAEESRWLVDSGGSYELYALLWACKESAYKHFVKRGIRCAFNPKAFNVSLVHHRSDSDHNSLIYSGNVYYKKMQCSCTASIVPQRYAHAIAATTAPQEARLLIVGRTQTAREELAAKVSEELSPLSKPGTSNHIHIRSDEHTRIPHLFINDQQTSLDLSISHDGPYLACAWGRQTPGSNE